MQRILVVEPQCRGFEHAQFNAALLATIRRSYPESGLEFYAEAGHAREVASILGRRGAAEGVGIGYRQMELPSSCGVWPDLPRDIGLCQAMLREAIGKRAWLLVFSSVKSTHLIALNWIMRRWDGPRVMAVPHSVLVGIGRSGKRIWNWPLGIRAALTLRQPEKLRLIALSETVYEAVSRRFDLRPWRRLDHPFLFGGRPAEVDVASNRSTGGPLRIALVGALRARLGDYCALVQGIMATGANVEFSVLGHVQSGKRAQALRRLIPGAATEPVSYAELERCGENIDYGLILPDPIYQRFAASAAILELFRLGRPGFFAASPLLEEYRARFGAFGYVCKSLGEVHEAIVAACRDFPMGEYREQLVAVARARKAFDPATLAAAFRQAAET